jgi:FtsH-binding integral membrane protein
MFTSLLAVIAMQLISIWLLVQLENKKDYMMFVGVALFVYGSFIILEIRSLSNRVELDNYIMAAFTLYIDLMTLFVYLLAACGKKK